MLNFENMNKDICFSLRLPFIWRPHNNTIKFVARLILFLISGVILACCEIVTVTVNISTISSTSDVCLYLHIRRTG